MVSAEDFEQWLENPVTRWVMAGCRKGAEMNKAAWVEASWASGEADPALLAELRTRADAYLALCETDHGRWAEILDDGETE